VHTRIRALAVVLALPLVFAACGDDSDDTATTGTSTTAAPTTIAAPTTTKAAPTTTTAAPVGGFAAGSPEAAAATAFATVFDSSTTFDAKKAHLADAAALADTITAYSGAGQRFGGIKLTPTAVTVAGDTATVTYDVYFGTNKQYSDLSGSIAKVGDTWLVSRGEFCGFMQSARTPCPA